MSTVTPPPPPTPPAPPPASAPTATVASPPPALTALPPGTTVEAQVQAQIQAQTQGTRPLVQVQTAYGTLQLQLSAPLPKTAATLLLTLQTLTPALVFQVSSIDGRPAQGRPGAALPTGADTTGATPARANAPAAPLPGGGATARPGAQAGTGAAGFSPALPGAVLGARVLTPLPGAIIAGAAPGTGDANATQGGAPQPLSGAAKAGGKTAGTGAGLLGRLFGTASAAKAAPGFGPAATPPAATGTQGATHSLTSGTGLALRIANLIAPAPNATTPPTPFISIGAGGAPPVITPGTPLTATIGGRTSQGLPIAQTPIGTMALETRTPLAAGTQVVFAVTADAPRPPLTPLAGALWLREGLAQTAAGWADLDEALAVLAKAAPAAHQAVIKTALPGANNRLASNMLFFLAALRGGDIRGWMGESALRVLNARAPDVLSRLGDDFAQLARTADEPASGDWRLTTLPFFTGEAIQPVRLFQRNRKRDDDDGDDPGSTRFVLDVELSRLGHLQLDGLVRPEHKHVDLIVRTERPLPIAIRRDIMAIFEDAGALTGMTGGLAFQAAPGALVDVSENGTATLPANLSL